MSQLIKEAFEQLYPDKEPKHDFSLKYSRKFRPYNANVRLYNNNLTFNLSREWKKINKDIQIGLIQELMGKILKNRKKTLNTDYYNIFMKHVHLAAPRIESDEYLLDSFYRVNDRYFYGMMDLTNLRWGTDSTSKLGSYEYGADTITISTIFKDSPQELLDYVVYHEMLHKKFKFQHKKSRNLHHSPEFKRMEKLFENADLMEKEISKLARKHKFSSRKAFSLF